MRGSKLTSVPSQKKSDRRLFTGRSSHFLTNSKLEAQFQTELELPWIKGRRRAAVVAPIVGTPGKGVDIGKERRRGCFVETIEEVKAFGDDVKAVTFTESQLAHHPQVK